MSQITGQRFDARSPPLMAQILSYVIFKLSGAAFRLVPPMGGLLVNGHNRFGLNGANARL